MDSLNQLLSLFVLSTVYALPQLHQQLSDRDNVVLREIFNAAKNGAEQAEIVSSMNAFLKQTTHFTPIEMNRKDGMRTMTVNNVRRRIGPPFSEFLRREQRQELLELIKYARAIGASREDVRMKVDEYLRKNLSAEKIAQIEKIKSEAVSLNERIHARRFVRHIDQRDEQIVQKYLNEGQQEQMSGLLYMGRSMGVSEDQIGESLDHYLQSVLDDESLTELGHEITLKRQKRI